MASAFSVLCRPRLTCGGHYEAIWKQAGGPPPKRRGPPVRRRVLITEPNCIQHWLPGWILSEARRTDEL